MIPSRKRPGGALRHRMDLALNSVQDAIDILASPVDPISMAAMAEETAR